jgi:tetratricopeptide (TPR) repeat protein
MGFALASTALAQPRSDTADDYRDVILAQLALDAGDFVTAASRFEDLASRDPARAEWANAAIGARMASGDPGAALRLARVAEAEGVALAAQARLVLAADALRARQWRRVAVVLDGLDGDPIEGMAASLLLAWALVGEGEVDAALGRLDAMPGVRAISSTLEFQRAMMLEQDRNWVAAARAYEVADAGSRVYVENILRYGAFLERRGQAEAARSLYARWRARVTNVALIAAEAGRFRAATPTIPASAALGLAGFGSALADDGAQSAAIALMGLGLLLDPDQQGVRLALGGRLRDAGQTSAAAAVLAPIAQPSVYYEVAQVEIAWLTLEQGRPDDAVAQARGLVSETGGRFALRALADIALRAERWAEAEAAYTALLGLADAEGVRQWRPLFGRAVALDRQGRWGEAEADLLAALSIAPNESMVLNALGYGWVSRGLRVEEGLGLIQRALAGSPNVAAFLDNEGWALYRLGRYEEAVAALERAQRRDPSNAVIAEHFGDALWRADRRREARYQWRRAAALTDRPEDRAAIEAKVANGLPDGL